MLSADRHSGVTQTVGIDENNTIHKHRINSVTGTQSEMTMTYQLTLATTQTLRMRESPQLQPPTATVIPSNVQSQDYVNLLISQ
jgi:hypothetical protein